MNGERKIPRTKPHPITKKFSSSLLINSISTVQGKEGEANGFGVGLGFHLYDVHQVEFFPSIVKGLSIGDNVVRFLVLTVIDAEPVRAIVPLSGPVVSAGFGLRLGEGLRKVQHFISNVGVI